MSPKINMRDTHTMPCFLNAQHALRITQAEAHNPPMSVGKNIRDRRQAMGWKILDLANKIDSDVGNLSRLERGKQGYSQETLQKIAHALGCTVADLFVDSAGVPADAQRVKGARKVWVIGNGQGGLPDRIWEDGGYPVGSSDRYAEERTDDERAFIVQVRGDSMAPRYMPGEYVLVEPSVAPEGGDEVLVRLASGETMLKRLLSRRNGIQLGSWNSPEVMNYSDADITWMYYVSNRVPAHKIKHWVETPEYSGEDRRQEQQDVEVFRTSDRRRGTVWYGSEQPAQRRKSDEK